VVFKDEALAPFGGRMRGAVKPDLVPGATLDGSHFAVMKEE
jgi:hypothetical protein